MIEPTTTPATLSAILEWHDLGVKPGGIANAMEAQGLPLPAGESSWCAEVVRAVLVGAGKLEATKGALKGLESDGEPVDWEAHNGPRYVPPRP